MIITKLGSLGAHSFADSFLSRPLEFFRHFKAAKPQTIVGSPTLPQSFDARD